MVFTGQYCFLLKITPVEIAKTWLKGAENWIQIPFIPPAIPFPQ